MTAKGNHETHETHETREKGKRASRPRRRGSLTVEWILLFTLLLIGALAGFTALSYSISRQQDALGTSVEGMNFPPQVPAAAPIEAPAPLVDSSSASSTFGPLP